MRLDGLTLRHRSAGGPERWRVICCAAGGRHNLVLALPDNSDSDRAQRTQCSPVSHWPHKLIVLCVVYIGVSTSTRLATDICQASRGKADLREAEAVVSLLRR